jgi:hypothetical protein
LSDKEKTKKERPVEKVRQFDPDTLPRDENGKIILPDDITYAEYLKLIHPEFTERDIAKIIQKENRNAWVVRFELLAIVIFAVVIIYLIVTS